MIDGPETEAHYQEMTEKIANRAKTLAADHPEVAAALHVYVERQEEEVEVLSGPLVGALWLLRRTD